MRRSSRRRTGFTLLEVMGVLLVMGLLLGFATDYYVDLSRASNRASRNTTDIRQATAVLDRLARDFESTVLVVKPPEMDPLAHPWLFVGESHYSQSGADHIKFVTFSSKRRHMSGHDSDLAVVAYTLEPNEATGGLELYRWSASQLPESLDRSFPPSDDEASFLLADGLADFGVTFFDESGETDAWDSTTLLASGTLPTSVEISVAMLDPDAPTAPGDEPPDPEDLVYYSRRVRLPVRPIDMAALLGTDQPGVDGGSGAAGDDTAGEGGSGGLDGAGKAAASNLTVADCLNLPALAAATQESMPAFSGYVESSLAQPWSEIAGMLPPELKAYVLSKPGCK